MTLVQSSRLKDKYANKERGLDRFLIAREENNPNEYKPIDIDMSQVVVSGEVERVAQFIKNREEMRRKRIEEEQRLATRDEIIDKLSVFGRIG